MPSKFEVEVMNILIEAEKLINNRLEEKRIIHENNSDFVITAFDNDKEYNIKLNFSKKSDGE